MYSLKFLLLGIIFLLQISNRIIAQNKSIRAETIKNLVLEGGGIRGIAYVGALMELKKSKMLDSITRVAGTSAGAIAATLYALGYTPEEISDEIYNLKIKSMADGKWIFIGGTSRLVRKFGWYQGNEFEKWISNLIKRKTGKENITFEELNKLSKTSSEFKELFLTGTNLTKQKLVIFCKDTYPKLEVRTAVRISMGIPLYYQAVIIDSDGKCIHKKKDYHKGDVMVDGGILGNFPIHIFDFEKFIKETGDSTPIINYQTIGLRLDNDQQIINDKQELGLAPVEIPNFNAYVGAFYNLIVENLNRQNLTSDDWQRTVSISTAGIGPRVKKMSEKEKNILIESGRKGVREYFEYKRK